MTLLALHCLLSRALAGQPKPKPDAAAAAFAAAASASAAAAAPATAASAQDIHHSTAAFALHTHSDQIVTRRVDSNHQSTMLLLQMALNVSGPLYEFI